MTDRLLLDMDGVLADTMGHLMNIVEEEHGLQICHYDMKDYWFDGLAAPRSMLIEVLQRPGFYRNLDVMTGAVRAVNRLREEYPVVVCTAPMKGAESCEEEKREWLEEHFDREFAEDAIVTTDKELVCGKVLVEDNPNVEHELACWTPIMFDQAWNRQSDFARMYGWHDLTPIYEAMQ